ncbi:MAG TPA: HD domain-containing phosphohydrolase [Geobacteraceae bacterium]|nr:HD domain-containing phosphohydrolase [Geobacteraceae bacterium]
MRENILFVDDDENILRSLETLFAGDDVTILLADNAKEALRLMGTREIAVLVTDKRMPEMSGIELLTVLKGTSPDTVKILMADHDDLPTPLEAASIDGLFHMIAKPWDNEALIHLVREGLEYYRLVMSLRSRDEASILSLAQAIELKDMHTTGHCDRVASYALMIADELGLPEETRQQIKYGSWLHDCGKINVSDTVLNFPGKLNDAEFSTIKKHPLWGAMLARQARLSQTIINIILYHHECYDGAGYPHGLRGDNIPLEARIVSIADTFDALTSKRPYREALPWDQAINLMDALSGVDLDPVLMNIFPSAIVKGLDTKLM